MSRPSFTSTPATSTESLFTKLTKIPNAERHFLNRSLDITPSQASSTTSLNFATPASSTTSLNIATPKAGSSTTTLARGKRSAPDLNTSMTPSEQQHATTQALLESRREARIIPRQNYVKGQDSALEGDHWKRMTANDKSAATVGAKAKPSIMDDVRYHDPVNKRGRIDPGHAAMNRDEYNKYSSQWKHPWFKDKDLGGTRKTVGAAGRDSRGSAGDYAFDS